MSIRRGRGYGVIKPKTGIKPIKGQRKPRPRKWPAHMDGEARDLAFAQELAIWERQVAEWEAGLRKTRPTRPRRT